MKKAWFLDRDGTIIEDKHYLSNPDDIVLLPGTVEALRMAQNDGFLLIVVTNQSGIARGYFTEADADSVDRRLYEMLKEADPESADKIPKENVHILFYIHFCVCIGYFLRTLSIRYVIPIC